MTPFRTTLGGAHVGTGDAVGSVSALAQCVGGGHTRLQFQAAAPAAWGHRGTNTSNVQKDHLKDRLMAQYHLAGAKDDPGHCSPDCCCWPSLPNMGRPASGPMLETAATSSGGTSSSDGSNPHLRMAILLFTAGSKPKPWLDATGGVNGCGSAQPFAECFGEALSGLNKSIAPPICLCRASKRSCNRRCCQRN